MATVAALVMLSFMTDSSGSSLSKVRSASSACSRLSSSACSSLAGAAWALLGWPSSRLRWGLAPCCTQPSTSPTPCSGVGWNVAPAMTGSTPLRPSGATPRRPRGSLLSCARPTLLQASQHQWPAAAPCHGPVGAGRSSSDHSRPGAAPPAGVPLHPRAAAGGRAAGCESALPPGRSHLADSAAPSSPLAWPGGSSPTGCRRITDPAPRPERACTTRGCDTRRAAAPPTPARTRAH